MSRIPICELAERQPAGRACTLLDVHSTRNLTYQSSSIPKRRTHKANNPKQLAVAAM